MNRKSSGAVVPILLAMVLAGGWGWFWYQPERAAIEGLRRNIRATQDHMGELRAELERANRTNLTVPIGSAEDADRRWAQVAGIFEQAGFAVERFEFGPVQSAAPMPAQGLGPPQGGAPIGAPQPLLAPPAPPGSAPIPSSPDVASPGPQASGVVTVRLSVRAKGDYTQLRPALERAAAAVPGLGWTRIELESQGDGVVTVVADLVIVALQGGM